MYIFLTIAYLLSIIHINGVKSVPFFDETTYNPCKTKLGLYFYPHPTDVHQYYQCDETGIAYIRSCGDLVWDELRIACNWPTAAIPSSSQAANPTVPTISWSAAAASWPTTTASWPSPTSSWPTATTASSWPSSTSSLPDTTSSQPSTEFPSTTTTTTVESSSTTDDSLFSLCKPVNPCGAHGQCIESPMTSPSSTRRFACICSENWFGRLCDKQIDELTTPSTMILDQDKKISATKDTFSLPAKTAKDSKLIFYGLKAGNTIPAYNETEKTIGSQ